MRAIAPDGTEIAFDVRGTGQPTVVLVHGGSCDRTYWQAQLGPLARQGPGVTVDLAGDGESGVGADWSIERFGLDVVAVVDRLDLTDVVLVGHSMGGEVVLEAALRLRARVRGIVWVDTYSQLARFNTPEQVQARIAPFQAQF